MLQRPRRDAGTAENYTEPFQTCVANLTIHIASVITLHSREHSPAHLRRAPRDFLQARGIPITYEGRRGPGGNIGVEFRDPDGYVVEIYYGMDQVEEAGKSRPPDQWKRARSLEDAVNDPLV